MRTTADNQHPDGSANGTPHRLYAGVVYLNDNFKGGMLYLDKLEVAIVPKPGLLIGVGSSATFAPLMADTSQWFARRRGTAVGIFASGNYLAGTLWPPVVQHFIAEAATALLCSP